VVLLQMYGDVSKTQIPFGNDKPKGLNPEQILFGNDKQKKLHLRGKISS